MKTLPSRAAAALIALAALSRALAMDAVPHDGFSLEPDRDVPWWHAGDTVSYHLQGTLPEAKVALEGVVRDAAGNEAARIRVPRAELASAGWKWKPGLPGYYEVSFSALDGQGAASPVGWTYAFRAPNGATRDFTRDRQGFAVLPTPLPAEKGVGQFGVICDNPEPNDIALDRLVGLDVIRLLIPWGATFSNAKRGIEAVQGEQHWELIDPAVDAYAKAGFTIYAQFLYTPTWASPHPEEADKIDICVRRANAYAPKDIAEFGRFVGQTVSRYKDRIHYWEMYNEPSIPGGSCFWADTPENYLKLLQAGHDAVKKIQPDGQVAFGGIGPNPGYFAFYDRLLALGAGDYFDILSLHGHDSLPSDRFRDIEAAHGVAPKTAFNTEWHAILQGNMQSTPILSDQALAFRMLRDVVLQLQDGVQKTLLFEMKNLVEKETLGFCIDNRYFTHSSGIFRRFPRIEPRLPAVTYANFLDLCGHRAAFVRSLRIGTDPDAAAVQLDTAHGSLVLFWSEERPLPLAALAPLAGPGASFRDWEGKPLDPGQTLEPKRIAYLIGADEGLLAKAKAGDRLLSPRVAERRVQASVRASFAAGPLFPSVNGASAVPDAAWIAKDWKRVKLAGGAPGFSARAAVGVHPGGLDLVVEVHDAVHVQAEEPASAWKGDSVQFAIDGDGSGRAGGSTELLFSLGAGGPAAWKILAADPHGDIPTRWSSAGGPARFVEQRIVREDGVTRYQVRIPWTEVFPLACDPARPLRLSLAVNDNDGQGRTEVLEWGGGIVEEKDSSAYGQLAPPGK